MMHSLFVIALSALPFIVGQSLSTTGRCGTQFGGLTCHGSTFGDCCSTYNYCGSSANHCSTGCQSNFGTCNVVPVAKVSTDGSCGGSSGFTCQGSSFGNCCSKYGFCGRTTAYCDSGCNSSFGTCGNVVAISSSRVSSSSAPSSSPSASQTISTNGRCGASFGGLTCVGSRYGNCCSQYSYWYVVTVIA